MVSVKPYLIYLIFTKNRTQVKLNFINFVHDVKPGSYISNHHPGGGRSVNVCLCQNVSMKTMPSSQGT